MELERLHDVDRGTAPTRVVVLLPRRRDYARRDLVWAWLADRWIREKPEWLLFEGHHESGLFNRAAALNQAAAAAGAWDVAIVADADSFCGSSQLDAAVEMAFQTGQVAFAHDRFCYLSREGSDLIMAGDRGAWEPLVEWSLHGSYSSMVAVPRRLFDSVGGFDPGFSGWGMEDVAFYIAARVVGGGSQRITGPVWHLWHPPSPENVSTPAFDANVRRLRDYEAHASSPETMLEFLRSLGRI